MLPVLRKFSLLANMVYVGVHASYIYMGNTHIRSSLTLWADSFSCTDFEADFQADKFMHA